MTQKEAEKIGGALGLVYAGVGIIIAQLIFMTILASEKGFWKGFFWFTTVNYKLNLFIGIVMICSCGYYYGKLAGKQILFKERHFVLVGILTGIAVLISTAFLSGWTGFFQEGIRNIGTDDNPFVDYILKPFFWITLFGIIPAIIVGVIFGFNIVKKATRQYPCK